MSSLRLWRRLFGGSKTLSDKISTALGKPVRLEFSHVGSQRIFSSPLDDGSLHVVLDPLFEHIDGDDLEGLLRYLKIGDESSKSEVIDYLRRVSDGVSSASPEYRLQLRLDELMKVHFSRLPHLKLVLGRIGKKGKQKSIRLASYWPSKGEVRVHPYMLDDTVPDYYITFLLFHELCHAELILSGKAKTGEHHGPDFYALEDQCPDVERCREWEKQHLADFLMSKAEAS